jgi:hypothetical protein
MALQQRSIVPVEKSALEAITVIKRKNVRKAT